jgi:hypothetical protein
MTYSSIGRPLILLFPILTLGRESWAAFILILLACLGVYIAFKENINPFKHQKIKLLSILTATYFGSLVVSTMLSEKSSALTDFTGGELFFLFAPFIALSIHMANINFDRLILIIKLGLTVLGIVVLYRSMEASRVLWVSHLGVMLLVFSWVNIGHENKYNLFLTFISSTLALNALLLAGTRGPVLCFIILSVIFIYLNNQHALNKYRNKVFAVSLFLISIFLIFNNDYIQSRFSDAYRNLVVWSMGSDSDIEGAVKNTSSAQRMEIYKAGLLAAKDKPLFGYGYNNTTASTSKYTPVNLRPALLQHTHLHNTYINTLVYGGVTALLISLITIYFMPFKIFWRGFNRESNAEYAFLGVLLIIGFAVLGMTDTMLGGIFENAFFIFFLSVSLPKAIHTEQV